MAYFTFVATRSIATGYTANDVVNVTIRMQIANRILKKHGKTHTSIGGKRFHRLQRIEEIYTFKTGPIIGDANKEIARMLFDSIADGSSFSCDPYSTNGANLLSMQVESEPKEDPISSQISVYSFKAVTVL